MAKKAGKFSAPSQPPRRNRTGMMVVIMLLFLLAAVLAGGLLLVNHTPSTAIQAPPPETTAPTEAQPPEPVVIPSGQKTRVDCKASYTVSPGTGNSQAVVATAGKQTLTAGMLQVLYLSQVNACRTGGGEMPDFSQSLDCQPCPLEKGLSWQHYFLKKAIENWQAQCAALEKAKQPRPITEEAFKPNYTKDLHGECIAPELPVNQFLYQDQPCYTPNSQHQAYLDGLEDTLDSLAQRFGYESLAGMAQRLGIRAEDCLQAARDYNLAYMLFTEESYDLTPTDGAVSTYLQKHSTELSGTGTEAVDIRHILLIPQGASVAPDGTVTATEAQWAETEQQAQKLLEELAGASKRLDAEGEFARLANTNSADQGSRLNGGYYRSLHPGQLIQPLNDWCFANDRQQGDTVVLRSDYGCHILYLTAFRESIMEGARAALVEEQAGKALKTWLKSVPLVPDYSAVELWADTTAAAPSLIDALYPDIAHQRFPEAIVYLQQDFYYFPFGDRSIGPNGCGITAFAMLCTYMTDSLQTPPMMAVRFEDAYYDQEFHSTDGNIFQYALPEMGFYLDRISNDIEDVIDALKNGQMVVTLQDKGHFTSKGHFLLLTNYYPEDQTIQVRDSNIYNYANLPGHKVDRFSQNLISKSNKNYYIIQPKIVSIPACSRCGSTPSVSGCPLTQDYTCEKCAAALTRRDCFLSLLG